ncbi:ABC transporter substrate-binding protein [Brassicibacter mesophilus]|uniref:ABC transporter substrate-binding protein n=1 Tax=Brassicibacter mesophilus TaxID=745119 RepID=UPI003D1B5481
MKKFKSTLALLLALAMILSLAACSKTENKQINNEPEKTEEQTESSTETSLEGTTLRIVATSESYKELFDKFTEKTGVKVEFVSMSSGELLSRTKAEGGKPMADFWFGGGLDAFMQAKKDGLLEAYKSPATEDIPDQYKDSDGYWVAKGMTIVGFIVNNEVIAENNLPMPTSWKDLTNPVYKDEIIMSNPAISGTNYAVVNGLLQAMGNEKGWKFFEELDKNIPYYGKRGKDPQLKATEGEAAIGITYIDKSIFDLQEERNMTVVYPEDGIPWVPEGMAIFKNAENLEAAKLFMDWIFSKEIQSEMAKLDGKDSAMMVKPDVEGLDLGVPKDRLLKLNLSSFGDDRETILTKWGKLVGDK